MANTWESVLEAILDEVKSLAIKGIEYGENAVIVINSKKMIKESMDVAKYLGYNTEQISKKSIECVSNAYNKNKSEKSPKILYDAVQRFDTWATKEAYSQLNIRPPKQ